MDPIYEAYSTSHAMMSLPKGVKDAGELRQYIVNNYANELRDGGFDMMRVKFAKKWIRILSILTNQDVRKVVQDLKKDIEAS